MDFSDLSPDTLRAVIEAHLDDIAELEQREPGNGHDDHTASNTLAAAELLRTELLAYVTSLSDQAICTRISESEAAGEDADATVSSVFGGTSPYGQGGSEAAGQEVEMRFSPLGLYREVLERLGLLNITPHGGSSGQGHASEAQNVDEPPAQQELERCVSCQDRFNLTNLAKAPCCHHYCRECLNNLFECSTLDESLFPPRCCREPIALDSCREFLAGSVVDRFLVKKQELETPNRVYCHDRVCSAFIPPAAAEGETAARDTVTCPACSKVTCTVCKGAGHDGDCPEDSALQEVLAVAGQEGWQRCYACRSLVELDHGCNHITCRCRAEFCYVCGLPWKTCGCNQWDEQRLLARAGEVVDRRPVANVLERQGLIQRAFEELVLNHECDHQRLRSRRGAFRCEECRDRLPEFIYECRQCLVRVCRRCRYNRL